MPRNTARNALGELLPGNAVMLPEIDPEAHLVINIETMEALEALYHLGSPDGYVVHCFSELEGNTLSVVKAMAAMAVRSCTVEQLLAAMPLNEVSRRLIDALSLTIYGRDAAEEMEHRQAKAIAKLEKIKAMRDAAEAAEASGHA